MQTIVHSKGYRYIHPIFDEFDRLYTALSNNDEVEHKQLVKVDDTFETSLEPFEDIFNEYGNCERKLKYADKDYPKFKEEKYDRKNVIVAFSGGKDSTATALYYKSKGFNVYLYHVHGLNRFFPYEQQSAEKVAEYLQMPLIIDNINLSGISLYPDHPLKNIIISNMALQWGIENKIGTFIAFGDYYTAVLKDVCFETEGDDCKEMWKIYKPIIKRYCPQFKFETPLINVADTMERLEKDKKLLGLTQSCVMTHRFKNKHNKRVQEKYNIELLPNRCGTCWKCALEYIYYTDKGVLEFNKLYYQYCLEILYRHSAVMRVNGSTVYSTEQYDIYKLWDSYFFYNISNSKLYPDLLEYEIDNIKRKIWFEPKKYNV